MADTLNRNSEDYKALLNTVSGEARGEERKGQEAVAWVIKNRADKNRSYWGGNTLAGVCKQPKQFECWTRGQFGTEAEKANIDKWLPHVYEGVDPTNGADHFINPDIGGYPKWTQNCQKGVKIGGHQFYHGN